MHTWYVLATEASGGHSNPLLPETNELFWGAICFVILLLAVGPKVFPKIAALLQERSSQIEGKMDEAERQRQHAESLVTESQQRLRDAHAQAQQIVDQARSNADRLEDELRLRAEDQARRIIDRANESITHERQRVQQELTAGVGTLAVDLAERIVKTSLDKNAHLQLIDRYIDELAATQK